MLEQTDGRADHDSRTEWGEDVADRGSDIDQIAAETDISTDASVSCTPHRTIAEPDEDPADRPLIQVAK